MTDDTPRPGSVPDTDVVEHTITIRPAARAAGGHPPALVLCYRCDEAADGVAPPGWAVDAKLAGSADAPAGFGVCPLCLADGVGVPHGFIRPG